MVQVLSLLVQNKAGVLSRVVGLFGQRGCNIESLNVAPTQDSSVSRVTLATGADGKYIAQIIVELRQLADVISATLYDPATHVVREMALVRVSVKEENRAEILALSEVFRARVIDASPTSYIFEVTGQSEKIDAFLDNVRVYGIYEVHRTGKLTLSRGSVTARGDLPASERGSLL